MKKKDTVTVVICVAVIVGCVIFFSGGFSFKGSGNSQGETITVTETTRFSGNIDESAVEKLNQKTKYGNIDDSNIGRSNPFATF